MGRHYRRHSSSRRKDESDDSYSDSRSRYYILCPNEFIEVVV